MPRLAPQREMRAKIVKTCDKINGICDRMGRTCEETAATFGKTIATDERIVRICGKTKESSVMTGNKCDRMHTPERVLGNCNRIGKILGTTAKICEVITVIYEPIAKIDVGIVMTSKRIDRIGTTIGKP